MWLTRESIERHIRSTVLKGESKETPDEVRNGTAILSLGTRVGLLEKFRCKGIEDDPEPLYFLDKAAYFRVRIQTGSRKGMICFVLKAYGNSDLFPGEPAIVSGVSIAAATFDGYTLDAFYKAWEAGDDRMTDVYLNLDRAFLLPRGTRLTVEGSLDDNLNVQVRVESGAAKGKLLYMKPYYVEAYYGVATYVPKALKAKPKKPKG